MFSKQIAKIVGPGARKPSLGEGKESVQKLLIYVIAHALDVASVPQLQSSQRELLVSSLLRVQAIKVNIYT